MMSSTDTGNYGKSALRVHADQLAFAMDDDTVSAHAANSWDSATRDVDTSINWVCSEDDDLADTDVSVSAELLETLLRKARAYDACTCTCGATGGRI